MEVNKTLYKKDSKGKIRMLKISTDNGLLVQESGLLDGKTVVHDSVSKPKNVGRANETTSAEQARLEAESKLKKKLDEGYFETVQEAKEEKVILPMLAKDFAKEKRKVKYPAFVQPKLDGMRALGHKGKLTSRGGKAITTLAHIQDAIQDAPFVLDGELYAHGKTFQENMTIIKKYRKGLTEEVKFHVYDIISDEPFFARYAKLASYVADNPVLELVPTLYVDSHEDVKVYHDEYVLNGYEGAIVRWGNEPYKIAGRSSNLLKVKEFIDAVAIVVDVEPSDKNPEHGQFICRLLPDDNLAPEANLVDTFGNGMAFSHEERAETLLNKSKYIGQTAEIRFFEYTDDGRPRFPVCVGIRLDK